MRMMNLAAAFVFAVGSAGCVTASATSLVNPAALTDTFVVEPVMVWFPIEDLQLRTETERAFVASMEERGAVAVAGVDILFPNRAYTADEIVAAASKEAVGSIMLVTFTGGNTSRTPATDLTTCMYEDASGNCGQVMQSTIGGQVIPSDASFQFNLYSGDGSTDLWTATVETTNQAGQLTDIQDMVTKAVQEAASQLAEDGLIGR